MGPLQIRAADLTGGGAALDAATGCLDRDDPEVRGVIHAVVPDGAGGWFIAGEFGAVGPQPRRNLAHIRSNKTVDPEWNPGANDSVYTMFDARGMLYIGGKFSLVGGQRRTYLAALEAATGRVTDWAPKSDNVVAALAGAGDRVYAGDVFGSIAGQPRNHIAALDAGSGNATDWNPDANGTVLALAVSGDRVFAGGTFTSIGGQARSHAAALDASTGRATDWNPNADSVVATLAVAGNTIYAGGGFARVGGERRLHIAALDAQSSHALEWNPAADGSVLSLLVSGDVLYAAGAFTWIGGKERHNLAALDRASGAATSWNPSADANAMALAIAGNTVYAGGNFTQIGAQEAPVEAVRAAAPKPKPQELNRPSFIIILCDDLGFGDLGCYGQTKIKTPNLDRLAAEGLRFTDFYACAPVCTPSRAGLLTGRYPVRLGLTRILHSNSRDGLDSSELTIAEALGERGYATACIGKWHLGRLPQFLPTRHGFDHYYGLPENNDLRSIPLVRNETTIELPADQETLTRRYTEEALKFLAETRDRPFFLYVAHTMPHTPTAASSAFRGRSAVGIYGDAVEEIDWSVGEILTALKRLGIDGDTLVVFTSDNGPALIKTRYQGSSGPLRDGKGTTFEGGIRVPCLAWWPGKIKPGRVEAQPAIMLDWFPTFVTLAGGTMPANRIIDGLDLSAVLLGTGRRAAEEFFFFSGERIQAHRWGRWKLKLPFQGRNHAGDPIENPLALFDLGADPGESHNLAGAQPDIVRRMRERMTEFEKGVTRDADGS